MRRAAPVLALLASTAAAAYIPTLGSLLKRAATQADDVDRGRDVTLKGTLAVGAGVPVAASLTLHFPLRCRLQTEGATGKGQSPGAVSVGKSSLAHPSVRRPKTFQTSRLRRDWNIRT